MTPVPRADVLGVGVSAVDLPAAVRIVTDAADARRGGYVCVTGVHGVMESQRDPELLRIHNASLLTTPDGMPTVWVGRSQGHRQMSRVYGPDLMLAVCDAGRSRGHTHYLYGAGPRVAGELQARLEQRFPGIAFVGAQTPPFRALSDEELWEIAASLQQLRPHYCWIGLSTPKQERLMARLAPAVPETVFLGVGAAFDMHAGRLPQAPRWMQRAGLEWFYRLLREPRRLWKRYLVNNPAFVAAVAVRKLRGRGTGDLAR